MATVEELEARQQRARQNLTLEQRQERARASVAPIPEPRGMPEEFGVGRTLRGLGSVGLGALEGFTLGVAPEAGAVGRTIAANLGFQPESGPQFPTSLSENLQQTEQIMQDLPQEARVLGNVAGGMALGRALPFAAPTTIPQAIGQGAGLGAIAGAGFAPGGVVERGVGAGEGAIMGGALAGGAQGIIQGIGALVARLRQGVDRPTAQALDRVLSELNAGDITPQQAINRVQRLGPEGLLADVPELQRLAQQAAVQTTAGNRIAQSALQGRSREASQRVGSVLEQAFGPGNLREARQAILRGRQQAAAPLYQQALSGGPLRRTDTLNDLIGTPTGRGTEGGSSVIRSTIRSIRGSNPRFRNAPDTDPELLHAVRTTLSERSRGQGAPKRNLNDVVQQLTDAMDDAGATGYRQATDQYRSDSLTLEAFDRGRRALNELPEDIEGFLRNAPTGEREAFVAGLGRQIVRNLEAGETGNVQAGIRSIMRGERADILRQTLGDEGFSAFRNRLLRELEFARTGQRVLGGSPTQPRQAAAAEQFERLGRAERAIRAVREGRGVLGAGAELVRAAERSGPQAAQNRALAQVLFRSQGQGLGQQRFGPNQTPLSEVLARQRLLQGGGNLISRFRQPAVGAAGVGGGLTAVELSQVLGP